MAYETRGPDVIHDMYLTGYRVLLTGPSGETAELRFRTFKSLKDELFEMAIPRGTLAEVSREYTTHRGLTDLEADTVTSVLNSRGQQ